jgi:hypothetical protein
MNLAMRMRVGQKIGMRVGLIGDDPFAGVTRDPGNLNYFPANAIEAGIFMAALGITSGGPSSIWNLQESSGNPADSVGAITLTANNITLYRQAISGVTRVCIRGVDGTANSNLRNATTAANPSTTSCLLMAFVDVAAAPAVARDMIALATNSDVRYNTNGKLRLVAGATADLVNVMVPGPQWIALRSNLTATTVTVFTAQEKFVGTWTAPTNAAHVALGGDNTAISASGYAYAWEFTGAAAEKTDAEMNIIFKGLGSAAPW